jgi:hypothetical protein
MITGVILNHLRCIFSPCIVGVAYGRFDHVKLGPVYYSALCSVLGGKKTKAKGGLFSTCHQSYRIIARDNKIVGGVLFVVAWLSVS